METGDHGQVVAVCLSPTGGVPKYPQESIVIGSQGVEGDYHAGPINRHKKTGPPEPNSRQITLVAREVLQELSTQFGIELKPGDLSENILVAGLGDLSRLQKGDRLQVGTDIILEVRGQNRPCDLIRVYHPALVEEITGRRGVAAVVVNPGIAQPGNPCWFVASSSESVQEKEGQRE